MNESRQQRLLEGQTSTTRKVYEHVPIREAWLEGDIARAMYGGHLRIGLHTIRACLLDLKDAGLIKEAQRNRYQRVAVIKKETKTTKTAPVQLPANEATMPATAKTPDSAPSATSAPSAATPLELLGVIGTDLTLLGVEFIGRIKAMAARVDEVALLVEAEREADKAKMNKVHQLRALMKDLGGDA